MTLRTRALRALAPVILASLVISVAGESFAQPGTRPQRPRPGQQEPPTPTANPLSEARPSPIDQKFRDLHNDFLRTALEVASDYMNNAEKTRDPAARRGEHEKAKLVCMQVLKLQPDFAPAQQMLERIQAMEAGAESVIVEVDASKDWQDTGVRLIVGKPVSLTVEGDWTLRLNAPVGPEGMTIPQEMRDFKLGELVGVIFTGNLRDVKPFSVGRSKQFVAEQSGILYLKMNDIDASDNVGKLRVKVEGTFESKPGR